MNTITTRGDGHKDDEHVVRTTILSILLALLLGLLVTTAIVLCARYIKKKPAIPSPVIDANIRSIEKTFLDKNLQGKNINFAGITDSTLKKGEKIALENLPENEDFLMIYTIINNDTGEEIFKTDMIPSGSCVLWTPSETLDTGTYHLSFLETPYYFVSPNYIPLTSGNNNVTINIL